MRTNSKMKQSGCLGFQSEVERLGLLDSISVISKGQIFN